MSTKPQVWALAAAALLLVASFPADAAEHTTEPATIYRSTPGSTRPLNSNVLPVLVRVDRAGKITYMQPAYNLRSKYAALLRQSLEAMITQPARNNLGQPIASEFVIYLTGKTTKRNDGKYDFMFSYLSARPVPFGQWVWGQFASGQLALLYPDMNHYYEQYSRRFRFNYSDGSCYYEGRYYTRCALYCVELGVACNSDGQPNQNKKTDDKSGATGTQITAASTRVYRLQRPSFAVRVRAEGYRRAGIDRRHAVRATRYWSPLTASHPAATSDAQAAPVAPVHSGFGGGFGATRGAPPEPVSRGPTH